MIWYEKVFPTFPLAVVALVITGAGTLPEAGRMATICIAQPLFAVAVAA